jgi:hypothetical protein
VRYTVTAFPTVTATFDQIQLFTFFEAIHTTQHADSLKIPRITYGRGL